MVGEEGSPPRGRSCVLNRSTPAERGIENEMGEREREGEGAKMRKV